MPAKGTVKDPVTGKFVKAASPFEVPMPTPEKAAEPEDKPVTVSQLSEEELMMFRAFLKREAEASVALDGETQSIGPAGETYGESSEASSEEVEPLRLQSRYSLRHTVWVVPPRRVYHPIAGTIEPIPGLAAQFKGAQRLFDSVAEQKEWGWTDEQRELVERKLLQGPGYRSDYYPAPLSPVPARLKEFDPMKEKVRDKLCTAFGYHDGKLVQCQMPATAGRDWCAEHDPDTTRIIRGGGTTVG